MVDVSKLSITFLSHIPRPLRALLGITIAAFVWVLMGDRVSEFRVTQGSMIAAYALAIISIVMLTGYSGQVSLGHGSFLAVGAYACALFLVNLHWPLWLSFFIAVIAAAIVGAIVGMAAARLSGPYLAGTTLAFAVGVPSISGLVSILGGEQGISWDAAEQYGPPSRYGDPYMFLNKWVYWICGAALILGIALAVNITKSRYGRIWRAVRADESAAALAGINVARSKILAFAVSAGFAGFAGAILSVTLSSVAPSTFGLSLSFLILTGAVIGGIRSIYGAIVGALALVILPMLSDIIASNASESIHTNLPGVITGALLVLTVLFNPGGTAAAFNHLVHGLRSRGPGSSH
ncbi:unannotated protein [freshwater metagenome]|uniref:Unannotated protein n=1 Tax=freshwater metagenome TaxID=449393 RepID=A0A6J7S8L0_9ZZZZ